MHRSCQVDGAGYEAAAADPVADFTEPICRHMNEGHPDANLAIVRRFVGLPATQARMTRIDALGADFEAVTAGGERVPVRVAYLEPATDRRSARERVVELTRIAQGPGGEGH